MDEKILTAKKVAELREIAKAFNIAGYQKLRKAELIKALTDTEYARTGAEKTETEPACNGDSVVKGVVVERVGIIGEQVMCCDMNIVV